MHLNIKPLKLVVVITGREKAGKLIQLLNENGFDFHDAFLGRGTAPTDITAFFGLSEPEKVILLCVLGQERKEKLLSLFKETDFFEHHGGVAFTIPINSLSNLDVFKLLTGIKIEENPETGYEGRENNCEVNKEVKNGK